MIRLAPYRWLDVRQINLWGIDRHIKIRSTSFLLMLLAIIGCSNHPANVAPISHNPKVLIFTAIDGEYLADTVAHWGNDVGVNGVILSYIADWWSTKDELTKNQALLKKINENGRPYGVDSNFIKVALGYRELPLWTDDQSWKTVTDNFRNIADLIKQSGTRGIAIDTERYNVSSLYNSHDKRFDAIKPDVLRKKIYERGRQIMLAITEAYPDIEVLVLQEGQFHLDVNNDKEYEMWMDFYNGMASVKNNQGITLGLESTFSTFNPLNLKGRYNNVQTAMGRAVSKHSFWRDKCSLAIGMWPLGKEYNNKTARYSPADFQRQFSQAVALSPKYVWIYDHGWAWLQLSKTEAEKYTKGGRWILAEEYQSLPTDPNIDKYYSVLRNYKQGNQ